MDTVCAVPQFRVRGHGTPTFYRPSYQIVVTRVVASSERAQVRPDHPNPLSPFGASTKNSIYFAFDVSDKCL